MSHRELAAAYSPNPRLFARGPNHFLVTALGELAAAYSQPEAFCQGSEPVSQEAILYRVEVIHSAQPIGGPKGWFLLPNKSGNNPAASLGAENYRCLCSYPFKQALVNACFKGRPYSNHRCILLRVLK